ncbi:Histidinol-phosphate aminotransferase [Hibiscus syriacus]|uniref:histidinol-phosphate transaminase n=1 Tax=Hibiscus syriacus TaxID=106335 RepID=A0A6A2ZPX4_HIBSY|nr:Histidinol-phosphate aminotransferase [Hibiscus syriacus]
MLNSGSLCLVKSNFHQAVNPQKPIYSFERNHKGFIMANIPSSPSNISKGFIAASISSSPSTVPAEPVNQKLSGDSFIRPHLRKLSPYQPILPFEVLSAKLGRKPEDIIKLDANENPYGPPPEVLEALGSLKFPYIYPDPESRQLRAALAEDSRIESDYILVGCGYVCLTLGDKILDCPPTFTMYEFDAGVNAAQVIKVPRKPDFGLNVEAIAEAVEREKPKCIFLTSPNNPDGSRFFLNLLLSESPLGGASDHYRLWGFNELCGLYFECEMLKLIISDEVLLKILDMPILVVLDEAYIEFSGIESRMQWVKIHDNLIVLRTFSKRAGLAGIRVGYGSFPLSIIEYLWRAKQPYNVSVAAEVAACAALQNPKYLEMVKEALVQERDRLFKLLQEVPFLNPYPSYSNFILCEVTSGMDAKKLKDDLSKMGVMVRHYNNKELKGYIRVTAGKPEQTNALMECLRRLS